MQIDSRGVVITLTNEEYLELVSDIDQLETDQSISEYSILIKLRNEMIK